MGSGSSQAVLVEGDPKTTLYQAYRREVSEERMVPSLRTGVWVVSGLFSFFILREQFNDFFIV